MNMIGRRVAFLLPLIAIAAMLAFGAAPASGWENEQQGEKEKPAGEQQGPTGPTAQAVPEVPAAPAPAAPTAPAPAAPAPVAPAPPAPAGQVGAQGGEVGAGGGEVGAGGGRELAQAPTGQELAAGGEVAAAGQEAPTELARTGSNLAGLALIAALFLVTAAIVFPRKSRKRALR
jgi:hypothetical protein